MNMSTMTNQDLLDTVVNALLKQGCVSVASSSSSANCLYRGLNGTKCAIGHLIPDELYTEDLEFGGIRSLFHSRTHLKVLQEAGIAHLSLDFLSLLQAAHDTDMRDGKEFYSARMRNIAHEYRLNTNVIDKLTRAEVEPS
jgi:hypothetical protein